MALRSIEEEWNDFAREVFRGWPIGHVQHQEMKKAFYAGVIVMLGVTREIGEPHVSDNQACAHLIALRKEAQAFVAALEAQERNN